MAKPKRETLLQMQRRKLWQQRADKRDAKKAANIQKYESEKSKIKPSSYSSHLMSGSSSSTYQNPLSRIKKEEFETWVEELWNEGYDLSDWTWEGLFEYYLNERKYDYNEPLPGSGKTPRQKAERKQQYHGASYFLRGRETRDRNDQAQTSHFNRGSTIDTVTKSMDKGEEPHKDPAWKNTIAARRRPRMQGEVPNERPGGLRAGNTTAAKVDDQGRVRSHRAVTRVNKEELEFQDGSPVFESIVEYLFVEGYANTIEGAEMMAANISETWMSEILDIDAYNAMHY